MRNHLITRAAGLALALGAVAGCNNDSLTGLNANPNNPTDAPPGPLFTFATNSAVSRFRGATFDLTGTSLFAQHFAKVQYVDEDQYRIRPQNINAFFQNPYSAELEDLQQVAKKGIAQKDAGLYGPALTMKTWVFGILTDTFGDIPYSQALQGDQPGASRTPKYDAQRDVYLGLYAALDSAAKGLQGASGTLGASDPIYNGSPAKWQRFANSMRARYALRVIKADPQLAAQQLQAAFTAPGGLMTSNADNAQLVWPGDGVNNNPWASNFQTRDDHRVSKTIVDTLAAYADPRLAIYAQPTTANRSVFAGLRNGLTTANAGTFFNTTSRPGAVFYPGNTAYGTYGSSAGLKTPSYLMTYAEVAFIRAEAAERGLAGLAAGQARGFYEDGIRASMQQWASAAGTSIAEADIAAFLAKTGIAYQGGAEGLRQIALQKWIALYTQGSEAWAEYRRTGVPALQPGPAAIVSTVPRRLVYAPAEQSTNGASLTDAIARQGADVMTTRVWWDRP